MLILWKNALNTIQDFIQAISIVKLYKNVPRIFERSRRTHDPSPPASGRLCAHLAARPSGSATPLQQALVAAVNLILAVSRRAFRSAKKKRARRSRSKQNIALKHSHCFRRRHEPEGFEGVRAPLKPPASSTESQRVPSESL